MVYPTTRPEIYYSQNKTINSNVKVSNSIMSNMTVAISISNKVLFTIIYSNVKLDSLWELQLS